MTLLDAVRTRLANLIAEKGIKQYTLYKEGGIPRSTISQVLSGKKNKIELHTIYEMTATMGVTLKEFFDDPLFDDISD
jgi:predicted transcriptional regulator